MRKITILLAIMLTVFTVQAQTTVQQIGPEDGAANAYFGYAVDISGDNIVVGAYGSSEAGSRAGSIYFFENNAGTWELTGSKINASDPDANKYFGKAVAIDGTTAIIGSPGDDVSTSFTVGGAAYIFDLVGGTWTQTIRLESDDIDVNDLFGISVDIYGDYAIVGASHDDDDADKSGSAYIFHNNGTTWEQYTKLTAPNAMVGDGFGRFVSIYEDFAVVSSWTDDGFACVYHNNNGTWEYHSTLTASDGISGDYYGADVTISGDHLIIGASAGDGVGNNTGCAYIYKYDANADTWNEQQKVYGNSDETAAVFGQAVGISGNYAVGGAGYTGNGTSYFFKNDEANWAQAYSTTITEDNTEYCLHGAAIYDNVYIFGADRQQNGDDWQAGVAYIYTRISDVNIIYSPVDKLNIPVGTNVTFSIQSRNATSFQWQESTDGGTVFNDISNGGIYSGADSETLTITGVSLDLNNNLYRCVVTNDNGNIIGEYARLTVVDNSGISTENSGIISIYPNPTNGIFNLTASVGLGSVSNIEISDITGKIIKQLSIQQFDNQIDISNQPAGIYFIKIQTESNIFTQRIIKK